MSKRASPDRLAVLALSVCLFICAGLLMIVVTYVIMNSELHPARSVEPVRLEMPEPEPGPRLAPPEAPTESAAGSPGSW